MTEFNEGFHEHVIVQESLILDGTKVGFWSDRIAAWKRGEHIAPITIDYAMTRECQAACTCCYAMLQENERKVQTKEVVFNFLSDCAEIGVKGVSFISDGESTVHKDYLEAIEYGHSLGLAIGASSNGVVLNRAKLERLLPCLSYLRFHFGAGTREGYAKIMGLRPHWFDQVTRNIKDAMAIKRERNLPVNINMQMVLMPQDKDEILPLARLAKEIRPDYLIIKHCADNKDGELGVDYTDYPALFPLLKEAESLSDDTFKVVVKWSRMDGVRTYSKCYGPPFLLQVSGSGLVAPCGFLFNEKHKKFHIGNICDTRFKDIWASERYWQVMQYLASDDFDPRSRCGPNCLQHNTNTFLFDHVHNGKALPMSAMPAQPEFI